jgi:hypothetical protein
MSPSSAEDDVTSTTLPSGSILDDCTETVTAQQRTATKTEVTGSSESCHHDENQTDTTLRTMIKTAVTQKGFL